VVLSFIVLVISLGLSLLVLALLTLAAGASPIAVLGSLAVGALGSQPAIMATLRETAPIALCGLAFLLPFKARFFNIAGQGALEVGALTTVALALWLAGWPPIVVVPLGLLAGAAAGMALILVPLALKTRRGASEVTTTIMINFAAIQLVFAMVTGPMKDPRAWYGTTLTVSAAYRLPTLPNLPEIHLGVPFAIITALLIYWILRRTVFGFHLAAAGANPSAARAAGIPVARVLVLTVCLGGVLAGLAGSMQVLGVMGRVAEGWSKPWGFMGILAGLLGGNPLGIIPAAFLLAVLESGARHMQAMTGVPAAMVHVMQALPVLLFLGIKATPLVRRFAEQPLRQPEPLGAPEESRAPVTPRP
jgi:simple sugar transport system permease protein